MQSAPRQPQMQSVEPVIQDHGIPALTDAEAATIRGLAKDRGAVYMNGNVPFISVRPATTSQRALARWKTSMHWPFFKPYGSPLTLDTAATRKLVVIDKFKLDPATGQPTGQADSILVQLATPPVESRVRIRNSFFLSAAGCYPVIGAWVQAAGGAVMMWNGARKALNPDTRAEGVASLVTGAWHFLWGGVCTVGNALTWGGFVPLQVLGNATGAVLDAAHWVGHRRTNPPPVLEINPAGGMTRTLANLASATEWITKPLAGPDGGLVVRARRMYEAAKARFGWGKSAPADQPQQPQQQLPPLVGPDGRTNPDFVNLMASQPMFVDAMRNPDFAQVVWNRPDFVNRMIQDPDFAEQNMAQAIGELQAQPPQPAAAAAAAMQGQRPQQPQGAAVGGR